MTTRKIPDKASFDELRAKLIDRGYTFRSFAIANHYPVPTVYCAARLSRRGIKTMRIRRHLMEVVNAK